MPTRLVLAQRTTDPHQDDIGHTLITWSGLSYELNLKLLLNYPVQVKYFMIVILTSKFFANNLSSSFERMRYSAIVYNSVVLAS